MENQTGLEYFRTAILQKFAGYQKTFLRGDEGMIKKGISILLIVFLMVTMLSGCFKSNKTGSNTEPTPEAKNEVTATEDPGKADPAASFNELKIQVLGFNQTGNNKPTEDVLTPIWREKTKVIPEIVASPPGTSGFEWIQKQVVADTLPHVLAVNGIAGDTDNYKLLKETNKLREIKKEDIINYMPRFTAWVEKMGGTIDQLYEDNLDRSDGKMWWVPNVIPYNALPEYRGTKLFEQQTGVWPYQSYVRDDVLKQIFPDVKTEAELRELWKKNGGTLSYEEVTDIPIDNLDELLDFFRKIKELNLKVGDKPVYAAHPQSSSSNVNSLVWSMFSATGNMWTITGERTTKDDVMTYMPMTPEWKNYLGFWNTAYNEGLLDPEGFIQKDDQLNAKIINGEYAVINWWAPVADARALSQKENRGYGYRYLSLFRGHEVNNKYQDYRYLPVSMTGSYNGIGVTTKVSDEAYAQVLNWIDWNMSEEANELRTWGLPEWSTGEGEARRFKPEYKDLENWAVGGVKSDKDGHYYGLYDINTNASTNAVAWNHETYGILGLSYAFSPRYVYPVDVNGPVDIDLVTNIVSTKHFLDQIKFFRQIGWDTGMLDPDGKFTEVDGTNGIYSNASNNAVIQAIVGKPADFEQNYEKYMAVFNDKFKGELDAMAGRWKEIFNKHIAPEIEKAE